MPEPAPPPHPIPRPWVCKKREYRVAYSIGALSTLPLSHSTHTEPQWNEVISPFWLNCHLWIKKPKCLPPACSCCSGFSHTNVYRLDSFWSICCTFPLYVPCLFVIECEHNASVRLCVHQCSCCVGLWPCDSCSNSMKLGSLLMLRRCWCQINHPGRFSVHTLVMPSWELVWVDAPVLLLAVASISSAPSLVAVESCCRVSLL